MKLAAEIFQKEQEKATEIYQKAQKNASKIYQKEQKNRLNKLKELFEQMNAGLKNEKDTNDQMALMMKKYKVTESEMISFNLSGTVITTFKSTLTKRIQVPNGKQGEFYPPHLLEGLISGLSDVKLDEKKAAFIDRNPQCFYPILDYLREVSVQFFN